MPLHVSSTMRSSSWGQKFIIQPLVSSRSVGGRPVHRLREDSSPTERDDTGGCIIQFLPPDDEHIVLETYRGI